MGYMLNILQVIVAFRLHSPTVTRNFTTERNNQKTRVLIKHFVGENIYNTKILVYFSAK